MSILLAAVCKFLKQQKSQDDRIETRLLLMQQKNTEQRRERSQYRSRGKGQCMPALPAKLTNSGQKSWCGRA